MFMRKCHCTAVVARSTAPQLECRLKGRQQDLANAAQSQVYGPISGQLLSNEMTPLAYA